MSQPYTSQALEQMTAAVEEKLRQERALLWRARSLHQRFLGDAVWMPCGAIETPEDRYIFEPRIMDDSQNGSMSQQRPSRMGTPSTSGDVNAAQEMSSKSALVKEVQQAQNEPENEPQTTENDVEMTEIPAPSGEPRPDNDTQEQITHLKSEEADATVSDLPPHPTTTDHPMQGGNEKAPTVNQDGAAIGGDNQEEMDTSKDGEKADNDATHDQMNDANEDVTEQDAEMHDGSSPEPPRRMTTRAQANAANPQGEAGSPSSSVDTDGELPTPHPLFLTPDSVRPDPNFGLPAAEAEETRRLLWSYIQKQEETVRGFEHMLDSLLRASHMKSNVLEWCKTEGHVGEMSDGEDWYDHEKLGLADGEDLKKGTDEDEVETVDDNRTTAKRGRGRRA